MYSFVILVDLKTSISDASIYYQSHSNLQKQIFLQTIREKKARSQNSTSSHAAYVSQS